MQRAISISNLCKTYSGKRGKRVAALNGLQLEVEPGQVFGFLGPNGAGKSTTIKLLLDLIRPTSGYCQIFGESPSKPDTRRLIGYLPENPAFYDYLSADQYLTFVGRAFRMGDKALSFRKEQVLNRVGLLGARRRLIRTYSKGMVQRLGIAQALIHDPQLLILDEPMSGLDPLGRALVKDIIREEKMKGNTVFFSTHITADVEAVCDQVGIIIGGKLRVVSSVQGVLESGLKGYSVESIGLDNKINHEIVEKKFLQEILNRMVNEGARIERIEPLRQDLETFFLDVVNRSGT